GPAPRARRRDTPEVDRRRRGRGGTHTGGAHPLRRASLDIAHGASNRDFTGAEVPGTAPSAGGHTGTAPGKSAARVEPRLVLACFLAPGSGALQPQGDGFVHQQATTFAHDG